MTPTDTITVGAAHAGVQAAQSLRQTRYNHPITLVPDAVDIPSLHQPLSRGYISSPENGPTLPRPALFFETNTITLLSAPRAFDLDRATGTIRIKDAAHSYVTALLKHCTIDDMSAVQN